MANEFKLCPRCRNAYIDPTMEVCDGAGSFERCKEVDSTGRRCNLSAQRHTRHQSNNSAWSAAPPTGREPR